MGEATLADQAPFVPLSVKSKTRRKETDYGGQGDDAGRSALERDDLILTRGGFPTRKVF
jgi:hypothetical protein